MCTISLISKNKRYSQIHDPILKLLHIIILTVPYKYVSQHKDAHYGSSGPGARVLWNLACQIALNAP